jgi:glycosyltransferase involved in cell wall biosynthesis
LAGLKAVAVLGWAGAGGAERRELEHLRHLVAVEGATVEVCALTGGDGRAIELYERGGIRWHRAPLPWSGSRVARARRLALLARRLRSMRPDLLLSYCTFPNVVTGLVWRGTGAQAAIWHQHDVLPAGRVGVALRDAVIHRARHVVVYSQTAHAYLATELGVSPERIRLVPAGVELLPAQAGRKEWRARLGLEESDFLACMVAGLHRFKDHETLLRAWGLARGRLEGVGRTPVLLLAGPDKGTEPALKALAYDLELGRSVRFLGEVDDVTGLLEACDAGVLSSRSESAPRAVLESMAAGLPVAATDIGAIRELLGPDGERFLSPAGDAQALADGIVRLVQDAAARRAEGHRNAARARTVFSLPRALHAYADVIAEVTGR